jgi:hypothetical protein
VVFGPFALGLEERPKIPERCELDEVPDSAARHLLQDAIGRASVMHGDTAACHFDGIVRMLCVSERLRHHIKLESNPTTLAARQAAIAAATALAE